MQDTQVERAHAAAGVHARAPPGLWQRAAGFVSCQWAQWLVWLPGSRRWLDLHCMLLGVGRLKKKNAENSRGYECP